MPLRVDILVLGLAIVPASVLRAEANPKPPHAEWRFLLTDYVDTWTGAFHDSRSGAFVSLERGFTSMVRASAPRVAAEYHEPLVSKREGAWAYTYVVAPAVAGKADRWSDSCAEDRKQHQQVVATFTSDAAPYLIWNFTSFTCSEKERARVIDFLFHDPNGWSTLMDAQSSMTVRNLREGDIARLPRGGSLEMLQPTLGLASAVERRRAGFDLSFSLMDSPAPANARLYFDRAGNLVNWKLEPPPVLR